MRTKIRVHTALIVLAVMGAGCANESPVKAPDPVAPPCASAAEDASIDVEFLERLVTMKVNICRGNDRVLVVLPPVDDSRANACRTPGGTAR